MDFNADRLQYLAGVTGLDDYRTAVLSESRHLGEQDEEEETVDIEVEEEGPIEDVGEVIPVADAEAALEDLGVALGLDVSVGEEEGGEEEVEMGAEEEEPVAEARLRRAIRKEIQAVLGEASATSDEQQFNRARRDKSVAASLGWGKWASGNVHRPRKNRVLSQGPGHAVGFGGPGFM
jgi:hypothetical protein